MQLNQLRELFTPLNKQSDSKLTLETIRMRGARLLLLLTIVHVFVFSGLEYAMRGHFGLTMVSTTLFALVAVSLTVLIKDQRIFRTAFTATLLSQVGAGLIAFEGHPLQIDFHMYFFAVFGLTVLLMDVPALIVGMLAIAVHHLLLSIIAPNLVFYGSADFGRVVFHAVVLVIEMVGLIWLVLRIQDVLTALQVESDKANEAARQQEKAVLRGQEIKIETDAERSKILVDLSILFGEVVDSASNGRFDKRVDQKFSDEELNTLALSMNGLMDTVSKGLSETTNVLSSIAKGDLTQRISGNYQGMFGELKDSANKTADKLSQIVGQLQLSSSELNNATDQVLDGANDLSERTTRQAATIEQTSAAMEQLAHTVLENAERASGARRTVGTAQLTAEQGGEVMRDATRAMQRITTSSSKISDIIGMIDNIAFQTNLLALNASVEAARAGEAGKGFAVVATEVRRLAQSAAQASQEVKTLIEASVGEVRGGSDLVSKAASNLENIVGTVGDVTSLMNEIADESRRQASSLEQLHAAVKIMDEMTQHNAVLVEKTNVSMGHTKTQVTQLKGIAGQFHISEGLGAAYGQTPETVPTGDARFLQQQIQKRQGGATATGNGSSLVASQESNNTGSTGVQKPVPITAVSRAVGAQPNAALDIVNDTDIEDWDEF